MIRNIVWTLESVRSPMSVELHDSPTLHLLELNVTKVIKWFPLFTNVLASVGPIVPGEPGYGTTKMGNRSMLKEQNAFYSLATLIQGWIECHMLCHFYPKRCALLHSKFQPTGFTKYNRIGKEVKHLISPNILMPMGLLYMGLWTDTRVWLQPSYQSLVEERTISPNLGKKRSVIFFFVFKSFWSTLSLFFFWLLMNKN